MSIAIAITLIFLAGICKGVVDTLQFHHSTSIFQHRGRFWNPKESWRNKYRNGDPEQGPRFPGSTTVFVSLTDAWHLFEMFRFASIRAALVVIAAEVYTLPVWVWLAVWVALLLPRAAGFHLMYSLLLKKE